MARKSGSACFESGVSGEGAWFMAAVNDLESWSDAGAGVNRQPSSGRLTPAVNITPHSCLQHSPILILISG
jgi:hypothetical protein